MVTETDKNTEQTRQTMCITYVHTYIFENQLFWGSEGRGGEYMDGTVSCWPLITIL